MANFVEDKPGARFVRSRQRIQRVYGVPFQTGDTPPDAAQKFVNARSRMFGVEPQDLRPASILADRLHTRQLMYIPETGDYKFTLVYFSQYKDGIPVFRADLRVLVRNEARSPVVLAASALRDLKGFSLGANLRNDVGRPDFVRERFTVARQAALAAVPGLISFTQPDVVVWAGVDEMEVQPGVALTFVGDDAGADGVANEKWVFVTDIQTGAILYQEDQILEVDVSGNVSGLATEAPAPSSAKPRS